MWCVPELNDEYIERMEDILDILARPPNESEPIVALDERPVPLRTDARPPKPARPGGVACRDSEYKRHGVANIFAIVAPHEGRHLTHATRDQKGPQFAKALKRISRAFPRAKKIHLIVDNLNTHCFKSLSTGLGEAEATALWARFELHYTPKHGSWLNPAEIEISLWSRECQGRNRVGTVAELRHRTSRWNRRANREHRTIDWRFRTEDARKTFGYER